MTHAVCVDLDGCGAWRFNSLRIDSRCDIGLAHSNWNFGVHVLDNSRKESRLSGTQGGHQIHEEDFFFFMSSRTSAAIASLSAVIRYLIDMTSKGRLFIAGHSLFISIFFISLPHPKWIKSNSNNAKYRGHSKELWDLIFIVCKYDSDRFEGHGERNPV